MKIESAARSLAYSPSGKHLVVGLGGDRDAMVKEGAVVVLSADTLEILEEARKQMFADPHQCSTRPSMELYC